MIKVSIRKKYLSLKLYNIYIKEKQFKVMHRQKDYYLKLCKKKKLPNSYVFESRTHEYLTVNSYFDLSCEREGNICKQI